MVLGDVAHDGQAQSRAAGLARPARVDAVEALEDPLEVLGRDADALVADGDLARRGRSTSPSSSVRSRRASSMTVTLPPSGE